MPLSRLILLTPDEFARWLETRAAVHAALVALSSVCDGAREHDNQGFNGVDSSFGKELARKKEGWLTLGQVRATRKMLQKYRKQIIRLINLDIATILNIPEDELLISKNMQPSIDLWVREWRFWGPGSDNAIFPDSPLKIHTEDIFI